MWNVTFSPEAKKLSFSKFKELFWDVKCFRHLDDEQRTSELAKHWEALTNKQYKPEKGN
jgi:hypothetical protein